MKLHEMIVAARIEIQDTDKSEWEDDELTRAIQKTVSTLSRFIPKRAVVETTITREVESEALTIASSTGTLTKKPVKSGSLSIPNKTLDTHYTINYLTGVITEVDSGLPDAAYTVDYETDPHLLDISVLLPEENYIKIDRIEYPVGDNPPTVVVFEIFGEFILVKSKEDLTDNSHLRIIYLKPWIAPTAGSEGDYPKHLDNPIIIGSAGQALIFKAEKYVQQSLTELALVNAAADSMATPLADINTALDKVTTYVTDADTAFDAAITALAAAATAFDKINSDAGRTYIADADTALDAYVTAIADANVALDAFVTAIAGSGTALAKVDTYLAGASNSSKALLAQIGTDALRTAISAALDAANAKLDSIDLSAVATHLTEADAALDKVIVYLESNTNEDAKYWLTKITTDISSLRTGVDIAVDAANVALDSVSFTNVGTYLTAAASALAKVATYLENNTSEDSKYWLTKITIDIASLRTAIGTAVDAINSTADGFDFDDVATHLTDANTALDRIAEMLTTTNRFKGSITGTFTVGEECTGGTSSAVGIVKEIDSNHITVEVKVGTFSAAETATGSSSSATIAGITIESPDGAAKILNKITTDIAGLRTAVGTALDEANTQLDTVVASSTGDLDLAKGKLTAAETALDKVATYLESNANGSAKILLEKIKTDIANLRTAVNTAVTAANVYLDEVDITDLQGAEGVWTEEVKHILTAAGIPNAEDLIEIGDGLINTSNAGDKPAAGYREYAETTLNMAEKWANKRRDFLQEATARTNAALGYTQEAAQRLVHLRSYIEEAGGWDDIAKTFITEAAQRLNETAALLGQAEKRTNVGLGFISEANQRLANLRTYVEQATGWGNVAAGFAGEASQRVALASQITSRESAKSLQMEGYVNEARTRLDNLRSYISQAEGWGTVASGFVNEATQRVSMAVGAISRERAKAEQATGYMAEAGMRLDNLRTYIEQATGWGNVARGFAEEAVQRISMAQRIIEEETAIARTASGYVEEATTRITNLRVYIEQSQAYSVISEGFISEARVRVETASSYINEARERTAWARSRIEEAAVRLTIADRYIAEGNGRIAATNSYITEGGGRLEMSKTFISEAEGRVAEVNAWAIQADRYGITSKEYLNIAGRLLASGQSKINEFLISIGQKPEFFSYKGSSEQFS